MIRPGTTADADGIAEVHVRSWQAAYRDLLPAEFLDGLSVERSAATWTRVLATPDTVTVAVADGEVVGFVNHVACRDEGATPDVGEITTIYVAPEWLGHGYGRALMEAALAALRAAGYREATLWVLEGNDRARRFYEASGWRPDGAEKDDTIGDQPVIEVRYRREL